MWGARAHTPVQGTKIAEAPAIVSCAVLSVSTDLSLSLVQ